MQIIKLTSDVYSIIENRDEDHSGGIRFTIFKKSKIKFKFKIKNQYCNTNMNSELLVN